MINKQCNGKLCHFLLLNQGSIVNYNAKVSLKIHFPSLQWRLLDCISRKVLSTSRNLITSQKCFPSAHRAVCDTHLQFERSFVFLHGFRCNDNPEANVHPAAISRITWELTWSHIKVSVLDNEINYSQPELNDVTLQFLFFTLMGHKRMTLQHIRSNRKQIYTVAKLSRKKISSAICCMLKSERMWSSHCFHGV